MDAQQRDALRREAELVAIQQFGTSSTAEVESVLAVLAYEQTLAQKHGKNQRAGYTWRMMREKGILPAVEQVVQRDAETVGYQSLVGMGLQDFAFESVVIRHAASFSREAVVRSRTRLTQIQNELAGKPRYWWVNHKQTYKAELEGGYIWSPKTKSNGHQHQSYTNLTLVRPGDVVLSYAGAEIRAIGVATSSFQERPKPESFGQAGQNWSDIGWLVPIKWSVLASPISPKSHLAEIKEHLPTKHSPLQSNGNGNQSCYLASVSAELGEIILKLAAESDASIPGRVQELQDECNADAVEQEIKDDKSLSETERNQLVYARVGQGLFRQRVLKIEKACRLTGVSDERFLIASHIKPWKDCANEERLDGHNGLMLAPHVDKLFDRGWISFDDNGDLLVADDVPGAVMNAWGFSAGLNVGSFSAKQKAYLEHHRTAVFRGGE